MYGVKTRPVPSRLTRRPMKERSYTQFEQSTIVIIQLSLSIPNRNGKIHPFQARPALNQLNLIPPEALQMNNAENYCSTVLGAASRILFA